MYSGKLNHIAYAKLHIINDVIIYY